MRSVSKSVSKKLINPESEEYLFAAARRGVALCRDRYEDAHPQCGYGKLALCRTDCVDGACRICQRKPSGGHSCALPRGADTQRGPPI